MLDLPINQWDSSIWVKWNSTWPFLRFPHTCRMRVRWFLTSRSYPTPKSVIWWPRPTRNSISTSSLEDNLPLAYSFLSLSTPTSPLVYSRTAKASIITFGSTRIISARTTDMAPQPTITATNWRWAKTAALSMMWAIVHIQNQTIPSLAPT